MSNMKAGLAGAGIWLGIVLVFNLVLAPIRLHREMTGRVVEGGAEPVNVRLLGVINLPDWTLDRPFYFVVYQVAEGVCFEWRTTGDSDSGLYGGSLPPKSGECSIQQSGDSRWLPGQVHRVGTKVLRCVYPPDFNAEPTTGALVVRWQALSRELPFSNRDELPEGKKSGWIDPFTVTIEVTRGGRLV